MESEAEGGLGGAALLGVLQGLTEFLPVSSSGHLVVFQRLFPVPGDDIAFDLVLHLGTLLPALWYYRADVLQVLRDTFSGEGPWAQRPGVRLALLVLIASVPTAIIGLSLEDTFEALFSRPDAVAIGFLITALWLGIASTRPPGERTLANVPWWVALAVGVAQGIAITPGISRSGATIGMALLLGVEREVAVKLSFLASVPAIGGAVLLRLNDADLSALDPSGLGLGFVVAAFTGWFALSGLVWIVKEGRVMWFSAYLVLASAFTALGVATGHL